jgi:hypothetical protein
MISDKPKPATLSLGIAKLNGFFAGILFAGASYIGLS